MNQNSGEIADESHIFFNGFKAKITKAKGQKLRY